MFGSAEAGANTFGGANVGTNLNFNFSHWCTFLNIGYQHRDRPHTSRYERTYDNGDFLNSYGHGKNRGNNVSIRTGLTWHFSERDDIGISALGIISQKNGSLDAKYQSNLPNSWSANSQHSRDRNPLNGGYVELNYNHKFGEGHSLSLLGTFNCWGGKSHSYYDQERFYPEDDFTDGECQLQIQDNNSHSWELKADYEIQHSDYLKLNAGFNGNSSHEVAPNLVYSGRTLSSMEMNSKLYNHFDYNNNISALYMTLGGKVRHFGYSAGLRSESWQVKSQTLGYSENEKDVPIFKNRFLHLFPSAYLSLTLPNDNEMQLNYSRRLNRPTSVQLNSFVNTARPQSIHYGNPALEPQYTDVLELNYLKSWEWHIISVSTYLHHTTNVINSISYLYNNLLYTTTENVSNKTDWGVEFTSKNSFFGSKLQLTTTVN